MAKEKSSKNGLKLFSVFLLFISLCLIGAGTYLSLNTKPEEQPSEGEAIIEEVEENLDVSSKEVTELFSKINFNNISLPGVDENIKDYYYVKTEITDDLKFYLALMSLEKVINYQAGEELSIPTEEIDQIINTMFISPRIEEYKNIDLGLGKVATYNAESKSYVISIDKEVADDSKYYGELYQAVKKDNDITVTVKSYYASLEQTETGAAYKIYQNDKKEKTISDETYKELPGTSTLDIDSLDSYEFVFTNVDGVYKFSSFRKVSE